MLPLPPPPTFPLCVGICGSWAGPCPWVPHGAPARSAAPPPPRRLPGAVSAFLCKPADTTAPLFTPAGQPFSESSTVCNGQRCLRPPLPSSNGLLALPGGSRAAQPAPARGRRSAAGGGCERGIGRRGNPSARPARAWPSPILSLSLSASASRRAGRNC